MPAPSEPLFDGDGGLEFLSAEWVAEARAFLHGQLSRKSSELQGVSFSLAEVATDAPSHLAPAGHTLGWAVYIENGQLRVERGDHRDTEQRVEFDFEDAADIGRIVYSKMKAEDFETLKRVAKRSEQRLARMGKSPTPPLKLPKQLASTFLRLHDHMALRTMPRYHAYSPKWVAVAQAFISRQAQLPEMQALLRGHKGTFTFCEQTNNPPKHLSPDGSPIGFYLGIRDEQAIASPGIPEHCDVKVYLDYATNCPVSGYVYADRSEEEMRQFLKTAMRAVQRTAKQENSPDMDKASAKLFRKLMAAGDVGQNALHDVLARHTKSAEATLDESLPARAKL